MSSAKAIVDAAIAGVSGSPGVQEKKSITSRAEAAGRRGRPLGHAALCCVAPSPPRAAAATALANPRAACFWVFPAQKTRSWFSRRLTALTAPKVGDQEPAVRLATTSAAHCRRHRRRRRQPPQFLPCRCLPLCSQARPPEVPLQVSRDRAGAAQVRRGSAAMVAVPPPLRCVALRLLRLPAPTFCRSGNIPPPAAATALPSRSIWVS